MREQLWRNFCNEKFKALYLSKFNSVLRNIDLALNFITAIATTASVASWGIWKQIPFLWITIVGISQLIVATKPFYPYLREQKRLTELQALHNQLAFEYEKLWVKSKQADVKNEFLKLREFHFKSLSHFQDINVWDKASWRIEARKKRDISLNVDYPINV